MGSGGPVPAQYKTSAVRPLEGGTEKPSREPPQTLPQEQLLEPWTALMHKQVADLCTYHFPYPAPKDAEEQILLDFR